MTNQQEFDLSWNQESMYTLGWCLGIASKMPLPTVESDLHSIFKYLPPEVDLERFLDQCNLIDNQTILQELEYYYGLHWAIRHPESWSLMNADKFKISIIRERRKAMEWVLDNSLIWDDIPLDT